jgi:glutathione synthase/RimK-type ligase-like ATP-grasp enzyme
MTTELPVGLATYAGVADLSEDDRLLVRALRERGIDAIPVVWDRPAETPTPVRLTVLRSVWNYHLFVDRFLDWVDRTHRRSPVWNPPRVVRWNARKSYLKELAARGVATVPTELVAKDRPRSAASIAEARGWDRIVIKPAVGAASHLAAAFDADDRARAEEHLGSVLEHSDALVQPFFPRVAEDGERSLVYFDGVLSHGAEWVVPFDSTLTARAARPSVPSAAMIELGHRAVACVDGPTMYARVDLLPEADGNWVVGELELIEPELFLRLDGGSPARFADAIMRRLPP